MLTSRGFDLWTDGYDACVRLSEESGSYPFVGYQKVLGKIYRTIKENPGDKILDVGLGTAVLTKKLYRDGYEIFGMDFSAKMLAIAKEKMPGSVLIQHDFLKGFPPNL